MLKVFFPGTQIFVCFAELSGAPRLWKSCPPAPTPPSLWVAALNCPQCLAVSQFQCIPQQERSHWERSVFRWLSAGLQGAAEEQGQSWAPALRGRSRAGQGFEPAPPSHSCTPLCRSSPANCEEAGSDFAGLTPLPAFLRESWFRRRASEAKRVGSPEVRPGDAAKDASERRSGHHGKHFSTPALRFILAICRRPGRRGLLVGAGDGRALLLGAPGGRCRQAAFRSRDGSVFLSSLLLYLDFLSSQHPASFHCIPFICAPKSRQNVRKNPLCAIDGASRPTVELVHLLTFLGPF